MPRRIAPIADPQATVLAPIATIATFNVTSEVASLNSDSPSSTVTRLRGRPTRRANATAATASGGATIAPSASAAANGRPGITMVITNATVNAVSRTSTTDSWKIGRISCRIATAEDSKAAAYSSGGNSTASTTSGLTSKAGTPGHEGDRQPGDDQQDRRRQREPGRDRVHDQDAEHQPDDGQHWFHGSPAWFLSAVHPTGHCCDSEQVPSWWTCHTTATRSGASAQG